MNFDQKFRLWIVIESSVVFYQSTKQDIIFECMYTLRLEKKSMYIDKKCHISEQAFCNRTELNGPDCAVIIP